MYGTRQNRSAILIPQNHCRFGEGCRSASSLSQHSQEASGFGVHVQVVRGRDDAKMLWGLQLDPETMVLHHCTVGSIAARSERIRECVGMVLAKVNNEAVQSPSEAMAKIVGVLDVDFYFEPRAEQVSSQLRRETDPVTSVPQCLHRFAC